ncbi:MAG: DUF1365 family protein [Candidatus Hinthialibacter antarcticus]|nr:DUF1365 family protein [Candidatus Hinthialibacter antarcticus]
MKSKIFHCQVMHARLHPMEHHFVYPLYMYALDLNELERLDNENPLFGYNRFRPVSIYDKDYLNKEDGSIQTKLFTLLSLHGFSEEIKQVVLLTSARYFNYVFNPVSFYYCYKNDGSLACVVAEVNNTFKEKHVYVLSRSQESNLKKYTRYSVDKQFHVSPFNDMQGAYEFHFADVTDSIDIHLDLMKQGQASLKTRLWGNTVPLTAKNLFFTLIQQPFVPWFTMPRIVWQAAKLYYGRKLKVYSKPNPSNVMTVRHAQMPLIDKCCAIMIKKVLTNVKNGCLQLILTDHSVEFYGDLHSRQRVSIKVNHSCFFRKAVLGGNIGFGESYVAGDWDTDNLTKLLVFFLENQTYLNNFVLRSAWLGRAANRVMHSFRKNTLVRSRENILAHYDLSNDFFKIFLDDTMTYSCAQFNSEQENLQQGQINKINLMIEKAKITSNDHVLEIGSGWGSFAIQAVKQTGCRVTTITLSAEQLKMARDRVKEEGLHDRIDVLNCDYRNMTGRFDKIISIEMIEAVGHEYLGEYFKQLDKLLNPDGAVVIQAIAVIDQNYESYRRESDWIQKHIFPGGVAPSLHVIAENAMKNSRFFIDHVENIGMDYARTLREWKQTFLSKKKNVADMGFDDEFIRKWEYYFSYCEAGFLTRILNTYQIVFKRPEVL